MSPRYYWITTLIVIVLTLTISYVTQKRSRKYLVMIAGWVILGIGVIAGMVIGLSRLLVYLGVAESGFAL